MTAHERGFDIRVSKDEMQAILVVHPEAGDGITPGAVLAHAATVRLVTDETLERRVADALDGLEPGPDLQERVIADAIPPVNGIDSHVRWDPDVVSASVIAALPGRGRDDTDLGDAPVAGDDADASPDAEDEASDAAAVNHYECSTLKIVEVDDVVGHYRPPTDGTPGRTVTGRELEARPGCTREFELDEATLKLCEGGAVVALAAGRVKVTDERAWVDPVLEIRGDVDFSTGNIDFGGAVKISGGVKDRFIVRCTGDTSVNDLVESATLLIGGDLYCGSGMTARERGQLVVDGDCEVSYLNQARGRIGGTLTCRRELIDSDLIVGGDLHVGRGAVVGGICVVTGRVEASVLGSGAGAPTRLILGEVPRTTHAVRRLREMIAELQDEIRSEEAKLEDLATADQTMLATARNQQEQRQTRLEAMQQKEEDLLRRIGRQRAVSLQVERRIHHRVILGICGRQYEIKDDLDGPIEVTIDDRNTPTISIRGGEPKPLLSVARSVEATYAAA